ncbi:MAG: hypothetical protein HRF43_17245, partial [Phycisphaerae bacterium]
MPSAPKTEEFKKLIARLDSSCIQHFQGAMNLCVSRGHFEVGPDHLLMRMLDEATGDVTAIFNTFKIDRVPLRRALQKVLDEMPSGHRGKPAVAPKLVELLASAAVLGDELGFEQIRSGLILLALAINPTHTRVGELTTELDRIDVDQLRDHFGEIVQAAPAAAAEEGRGPGGARPGGAAEGGALEQFTVDLT